MARLRRRSRRIPDTWDTANASDFRRLNTPAYPVFNPNVRLDPSRVRDRRNEDDKALPLMHVLSWAQSRPGAVRNMLGEVFGTRDTLKEAQARLARMDQTLAQIKGTRRQTSVTRAGSAPPRRPSLAAGAYPDGAGQPPRVPITVRTVEGLDGQPKRQAYRGNRLLKRSRSRSGGARTY